MSARALRSRPTYPSPYRADSDRRAKSPPMSSPKHLHGTRGRRAASADEAIDINHLHFETGNRQRFSQFSKQLAAEVMLRSDWVRLDATNIVTSSPVITRVDLRSQNLSWQEHRSYRFGKGGNYQTSSGILAKALRRRRCSKRAPWRLGAPRLPLRRLGCRRAKARSSRSGKHNAKGGRAQIAYQVSASGRTSG